MIAGSLCINNKTDLLFFFSSRRRHTIYWRDWSSDVCSSDLRGLVAVVTAGTSDSPVAAEAATTVRVFGADVVRVADVGVAGLHRVLDARPVLQDADIVIVVAGMEGALPSVIGGVGGATGGGGAARRRGVGGRR